jgi:hypothetical protein
MRKIQINLKFKITQKDHTEDKCWIDKKHQKKIIKFVYSKQKYYYYSNIII